MGIADLRNLAENRRDDLAKRLHNEEVRILWTYLFTEFYQKPSARILSAQHSMTETIDRASVVQLLPNECLYLIMVRGSDSLNEFEASLIRPAVQRTGQCVHRTGQRRVDAGPTGGDCLTGECG